MEHSRDTMAALLITEVLRTMGVVMDTDILLQDLMIVASESGLRESESA
jgi:hypothetical protein